MAAIVYFGLDQCFRSAILASAGYEVRPCGLSPATLEEAVRRGPVDAIAVCEQDLSCDLDFATIARSIQGAAPLILFGDVNEKLQRSCFDLVIDPLTPAHAWIEAVADVIERSRRLMKTSQLLRKESVDLRAESEQVRNKSRLERARSRAQCGKEPNPSE